MLQVVVVSLWLSTKLKLKRTMPSKVGTPLHPRPVQWPESHRRMSSLYKNNRGVPLVWILYDHFPVPGSSLDFQDVRTRFRPVLRSIPIFILEAGCLLDGQSFPIVPPMFHCHWSRLDFPSPWAEREYYCFLIPKQDLWARWVCSNC